MDTKKLRQKILDLAIHGKLVPQDSNDEPASVLLERIRAEKERLIKEGKIKKNKASKTSDTPHYEQVPFEVPDGWEWTNIEELFFVTKLAGFEYTDYLTKDTISSNNAVPIVRAQNVRMGYFIENTNEAISEVLSQQLERSALTKKCLLMTFIGAGIGDTCIFPALKRCHLAPNVAKIEPYYDEMDLRYALYYLMSDIGQLGVRGISKSTAQPSLSMATIRSLEVALPPLAEQERIVSEIQRWFVVIDQIEQEKVELHAVINQTKSKILDLAIHGKLVPQDPSDEPASELLKRINSKAELTCDNGQYGKIPDGWCLCKLGDIGEIVTGNTPTKDIAEYYGGNIPFYKPSDLEEGKFIKNASDNLSVLGFEQARKIPANSILVTCIGATIGKTGLIIVEGSCNQQINAIIPNEAAYAEFIYYTCISDYMQKEIKSNASATTLPILNKRNFAKLPFPLPPLAEQQHIVTKIEELFTSLDNIQKALEV